MGGQAGRPTTGQGASGPGGPIQRRALLADTVADGIVRVLDARSGSVGRLTRDGINATPRWTADGRTLFFTKQP
jgi:hypothetical protein